MNEQEFLGQFDSKSNAPMDEKAFLSQFDAKANAPMDEKSFLGQFAGDVWGETKKAAKAIARVGSSVATATGTFPASGIKGTGVLLSELLQGKSMDEALTAGDKSVHEFRSRLFVAHKSSVTKLG